MSKLYVAGDSFATLSLDQQPGVSWSELIATFYNYDLVNISRCASSNFSIAIQLDWIMRSLTKDDFVIILLTDVRRKTLIDIDVTKPVNCHMLEYHSIHEGQRADINVNYSKEPYLISSVVHHKGKPERYYREWFDREIQEFEDKLVLTGSFKKLSCVTNNFLVIQGGFNNISHSTFCIEEFQFVPLTRVKIREWVEPNNLRNKNLEIMRSNHMDELAHRHMFNYLKPYINYIQSKL